MEKERYVEEEIERKRKRESFECFYYRLINPIVVAPTMAAVGLAFFSYGFPQAGSCVEISIPLIMLLLFFTLYIRGVSISGHRIFQIYACCACCAVMSSFPVLV